MPLPAPIFRPGASALFRAWLVLAGLLVAFGAQMVFAYYHSPWWTREDLAPDQPVMFSHRHHARELGIDCRYCHSSVETSAFAGMPPTQTCLSCHSQIFTDTAMLRPVVESAKRGQPLRWTSVTRLPGFAYFDHSIHVAKGVGCTTCHGAIGDMALAEKGARLDMRECVACHRDPAPALRAPADVFALNWKPKRDLLANHAALLAARGIETRHLTNCSTCHR